MNALEPLGPESLTWQYYGLWVGLFGGPVPQLLQLMHPKLGQGVDDHSNVKVDPFGRLLRSMGPIYGVVYDGPQAASTGAAIRGYHEQIRGRMPSGERYSALDPEVFSWAHATFVHGAVYGFSDLLGPFTREMQEQIYEESKRWYALYGVSDRYVPATLDDFDVYFAKYLSDVLEPTPAARWLLRTFVKPPQPPGLTRVPDLAWSPVARLGGQAAVAFATGQMPAIAREKLGMRWTRIERAEHRALLGGQRALVAATPPSRRYHPRALAGWKREAEARGTTVTRLIRESAWR